MQPSTTDYYQSEKYCNLCATISNNMQFGLAINQARWSEAYYDMLLRAGDPDVYGYLFPTLPAERRHVLPINRIKPDCEAIAGIQRTHRKQAYVRPLLPMYEDVANVSNKALKWISDNDNSQETFSTAFDKGALTTGLGLISIWMDYREDPISGDIYTTYLPYRSYMIDPDWYGSDMSNCRYVHTNTITGREIALSMYPQYASEIHKNIGVNPFFHREHMMECNMCAIEEYWYLCYRKQKNVIDMKSGIYFEWEGNDEGLQRFLRISSQLQSYDSTVTSCKRALIINGCVVDEDWNPMGIDMMPFAPVLGYVFPDLRDIYKIQGVVRGMRALQYIYARQRTLELYSIEKQVFPRFYREEDTLVNPEDLDNPTSNRNIKGKRGEGQMPIRFEESNLLSNSMNYSQVLQQEMNYYSGINQEVTGSVNSDIAAALAQSRQGAGINNQQTLFDNADNGFRIMEQVKLECMYKNFTPAKIERITGEIPPDAFYTGVLPKYKITVEQGLLSTAQRNIEAMKLIELRNMGIDISSNRIIDAMQLNDAPNIKREIEQAEQSKAQSAQQQQQIDMMMATEKFQKEINYLDKAAQANECMAKERCSRVQENEGLAIKNIAQAESERASALLDQVKAIKEIEEMELDNAQKSLDIAQKISSTF